jgi:hypothetical protein
MISKFGDESSISIESQNRDQILTNVDTNAGEKSDLFELPNKALFPQSGNFWNDQIVNEFVASYISKLNPNYKFLCEIAGRVNREVGAID